LQHFQIAYVPAFYDKPYGGTNLMKSFISGGSGIDVQAMKFGIKDHFQDMRMAANKQLGRLDFELVPDLGFVPPRIPSDVGHQHIHFLAKKAQRFREHAANDMVVNVAVHGFQGFESRKPVGSFGVADVAGVPDFVNRFEKAENTRAYCAVGVGKQTNSFHASKSKKDLGI
jgi:hypothetical protein